jgi:SAM-dependent methyltransferase
MAEGGDVRWVGSMADEYDRWLRPVLFEPFAVDLAARIAAVEPGDLLELAAGTGVLTEHVAAPRIVATDLNPAMAVVGSRRVPEARWAVADALRLPFPADSFDVVAHQFGVMFLPDRTASHAEAARVLRPGGRLLFSTWGPIGEHAFGAALTAALDDVLPGGAPPFLERVPHGYHDADRLVADVEAAGLRVREVTPVRLEGRAPDARTIALGFCHGTPVRAGVQAVAELDVTVDAVTAHIAERLGDGEIVGSMLAHVVDAERVG